MCRVLGVSPSGYYSWRSRGESKRSREDRRLLVEIRAVYAEMKKRYGSPRIHRELGAKGIRVGEKRVARLMHRDGLSARQARKFKVTTDSEHSFPIAANTLDRDFEVVVPNARWCSDISVP